MCNLTELASRLFLSIWMKMGNCLNYENEGSKRQSDSHRSDQLPTRCKPHLHPASDLTPIVPLTAKTTFGKLHSLYIFVRESLQLKARESYHSYHSYHSKRQKKMPFALPRAMRGKLHLSERTTYSRPVTWLIFSKPGHLRKVPKIRINIVRVYGLRHPVSGFPISPTDLTPILPAYRMRVPALASQ